MTTAPALRYITLDAAGQEGFVNSLLNLDETRKAIRPKRVIGIAVNPFGTGPHITGTLGVNRQANDARLTATQDPLSTDLHA